MTKPTIFIIGATGRVGSATVQRLSEKHGADFDLRVGVRDVGKAEHLRGLQSVILVQAEMGGDGLKEKFCDVDALFIVTPPVERCQRVEKTASDAKAAGVNFVLVLSDATVALKETMFGSESAEMEEKVKGVGVNLCFLRLHSFYENMLCYAKSVRSQSCFDGPCDGDQRFAQLAVADIAKVASSILTDWGRHANKTYELASQLIGYNDVANALASSLKKDVRYVRKPYDDIRGGWLKDGWPEMFCDSLIEYFKLVDAASPALTTADLSVVESITGESPLTLQKFVDSKSASFVEPEVNT